MKLLTNLSIAVVLFFSCGDAQKEQKTDEKKKTNHREEIRLKQYSVKGAQLYKQYCANCHQSSGKGLASLYPPLAASDYLLADLPRAACIIKNGQAKEIEVNGVKYSQMMPGNDLTNLEVAEVLTYISNAWGNDAGLSGVKEVEKWLQDCNEE